MTYTGGANSDTVHQFMACMTARDVEGALGFLSEDITIWEPEGLPYGGTYIGHQGFLDFAARLGQTWKSWRDGDYTYADAGDVTFKGNAFTARSRRTGEEITMHLVEVFYFRGSKIVGIRPHYWDVAAVIRAAG